jgi:hypothetical protein
MISEAIGRHRHGFAARCEEAAMPFRLSLAYLLGLRPRA